MEPEWSLEKVLIEEDTPLGAELKIRNNHFQI